MWVGEGMRDSYLIVYVFGKLLHEANIELCLRERERETMNVSEIPLRELLS